MVTAQRARESLHSQESHGKEGDEAAVAFYPFSYIDKARPGYLYYNGYSMCEVSKKKEKIKRTFEPATGCAASYGSGKRCRKFISCREGCDVDTRRQERGMVRRYSTPTSKSNGENENVEKVN